MYQNKVLISKKILVSHILLAVPTTGEMGYYMVPIEENG